MSSRPARAVQRALWRGRRGVLRAVDRALSGRAPTGIQADRLQDRTQVHLGWGLTPDRLRSAYLQADSGRPAAQYNIFDDILERDQTLGGMSTSRSAALSGKNVVVIAGGEDPDDIANSEDFDEMWRAMRPRGMIQALTDCTNVYGFKAVELEWARVEKAWAVGRYAPIRSEHFEITTATNRPELDEDQLLLVMRNGRREQLIPGKWVVDVRTSRVSLSRAGLMRGSSWTSLIKAMTLADWSVYVHRYGIPFVLAQMMDWTDDEARSKVEQVLQQMLDGTGAAIVPESDIVRVDFKDGIRSAGSTNSDLHQGLVTLLNIEMANSWEGASLASQTGDGAGSYALAAQHGGIRWELLLADAMRISETIQTCLIEPWMIFNGRKGKAPMIRFHLIRIADPMQLATTAKMLESMGVGLNIDTLLEHIGLQGDSTRNGQEDDNNDSQ